MELLFIITTVLFACCFGLLICVISYAARLKNELKEIKAIDPLREIEKWHDIFKRIDKAEAKGNVFPDPVAELAVQFTNDYKILINNEKV